METLIPCSHRRRAHGYNRGRKGGEYSGKLQVQKQGRRVETRELHKIVVDGLLIKIIESMGLWVDVGVLD